MLGLLNQAKTLTSVRTQYLTAFGSSGRSPRGHFCPEIAFGIFWSTPFAVSFREFLEVL